MLRRRDVSWRRGTHSSIRSGIAIDRFARSVSGSTTGIRHWGWALLFAGVQFFLTLYGYDLPAPVDWVPLLMMSLTVGLFEAVFFRGFVQTRLEASFGPAVGVGGAGLLYSAYHIGYGMGTGRDGVPARAGCRLHRGVQDRPQPARSVASPNSDWARSSRTCHQVISGCRGSRSRGSPMCLRSWPPQSRWLTVANGALAHSVAGPLKSQP